VQGLNPKGGDGLERAPRDDEPFAALAFKIMQDPFVGRVAFFRVYSGKIEAGTTVLNSSRDRRERIGRIVRMHANDREDITEVYAGDIAALLGPKETLTGDTLCEPGNAIILESITFPEPVVSVAIEPKTKDDQDKLGHVLAKLAEEDPTFRRTFNEETGQTIISGMGELHLDVLVDRMKREYRIEANVGRPQVAFREAISRPARAREPFKRQTGGKGQYGDVELTVTPRERGAGFEFVDQIVGGSIPREFMSAVQAGVREAMESGVIAGYPVVDVSVAAVDGSFHPVDSSEIAFKVAASQTLKAALKAASPVILEPVFKLEVRTPEDFFGDVMGDITRRRGHIIGTEAMGSTQIVRAVVPLAELFGYTTDLRSMSQGRASASQEFDHYEEAPRQVVETLSAKAR
jgi:elongation factor G